MNIPTCVKLLKKVQLVNHVKLENPVIVSVILWEFTIVPTKESSKRAVWWKFLFNS